ncbi:MAG: DUF2163 domain-containing protein [Pseudomonadota bacterium]
MRTFFGRELDSVATFWRLYRADGVTLGFTSHDRALRFGGIIHRASPGMVPAAIRRTSTLSEDSAEVEGALSHDAISELELRAGLYDAAAIEIGAVDWHSLEHMSLYRGRIGQIEDNQSSFTAQLRSSKALLEQDLVPRTSPTCRAEFCGRGCNLSAAAFTHTRTLADFDLDQNLVMFFGIDEQDYVDGRVRFLAGPQTGITFGIVSGTGAGLTLDRPLISGLEIGMRAELLQGCDHTLETCANRFANTTNFRGEPFLPGNDLLSRYGQGGA